MGACHNPAGTASGKPFNDLDQADLAIATGTSHRWDTRMAPVGDPSYDPTMYGALSRFGLRVPAADPSAPGVNEIQDYSINIMLQKFDYVVTCSVCHGQHSQSAYSWDAFSEDSGNATAGSSNIVIEDASKTWTDDQWKGYSVEMTAGTAVNVGQRRKIATNTSNTLTIVYNDSDPNFPRFPASVAAGDVYVINGGHFQRISNELNQMCEDCHYYKTTAAQTDVKTYDGTKKSHPVVKNLTTDVTDPTKFVGSAPLEPNGSVQIAAPRYHLNGTGDSNFTNNIIFDKNGKVRCLSCHGIHYTDSDSSTTDQ